MFNWLTNWLFSDNDSYRDRDACLRLRQAILMHLQYLRQRERVADTSDGAAWSHIVQASSSIDLHFRYPSEQSFRAAQRHFQLALHLSGQQSQWGADLLALKVRAEQRIAELKQVLPERPFTAEERCGHLDHVSRPPHFYSVYGTVDHYMRYCEYEGLFRYIDAELERLKRFPWLAE